MLTPEGLSQLIQAIYAAAEKPALWQTFLERMCAEVAAPAATMCIHDFRNYRARIEVSFSWERADLEIYRTDWVKKDPWFPGERLRSGQVLPSQAICSDRDFEKSECYNEFYRQVDVFQGMGGIINVDSHANLGIYFNYPRSSPPCGAEQLHLLRLLMPHLRQAVQLHRRLQGQELTETAMTQFVDHLPVGFVLLGLDGRVARMNREAERILREQDGLRQASGALRAWLSRDQQALEYLIRSALATTDQGGASPGGLARITRPSGKTAYQVIVTPLGPGGRLFEIHRAAAVLLLTDPARSPRPRITAIRKLFGFTQAEARVAVALLEGQRTDEIADNLRITQNTLRTHLKNLYSKAGARGQGDLIRLLLRSAPSHWEDGTEVTDAARDDARSSKTEIT